MYSEFRRIDPSGRIVETDRAGTPREILSPVLPRNGFSSFRMTVLLPAGEETWFDVGQNPVDAVRVTFYDESPEGTLRELPTRYRTTVPDSGALTVWMDVWVPRDPPRAGSSSSRRCTRPGIG